MGCILAPRNRIHPMFGQLFAGVGLGLLVGVLVGLSSSPVVAVVVGALASGMVTLLGFVRSAKDGEPSYSEGSVFRLGGFGVACAAAVLLGLSVRTHNWVSPSIAQQVSEVHKAGYSDQEARRWVAYKNVGAILESGSSSGSSSPSTPVHGSEPVAGSVLFSGADSGECQHFDTSRYKNAPEHLYSLRQLGGKYAGYAEKISTLDATQQKTVLESLRLLFCPQ
jgi:hypothetical protein